MPTFLVRFFEIEAAGGLVLVACAAIAVAWASSPFGDSYVSTFDGDVHHWINDWLMSIFFFVVGLEVKRELVRGELRDRKAAALPIFSALGGMIVPAAIYAAINVGRTGAEGWGIPLATDIAFAVGVLTLVGRRAPAGLKVFLLSLAVVDDIGAILLIAVFYAGGIHLTVVGVALGLALPAGSTAERLEHALHPFSTFVVVPLFALANTGVRLDGDALEGAGAAAVTLGIVAGLCAGKILGVTLGAWLSVRLGAAVLPTGVTWPHVVGVGALAGIGLTVSLFIADLAFADGPLLSAAKVGVLAASVLSALLGLAILWTSTRDVKV